MGVLLGISQGRQGVILRSFIVRSCCTADGLVLYRGSMGHLGILEGLCCIKS